MKVAAKEADETQYWLMLCESYTEVILIAKLFLANWMKFKES